MNKLLCYSLFLSFFCSNICSEQLFYNAKFKNIGAGEAKIELIKEHIDSTTLAIHFTLRTRKARKGRNPQTGEEIKIKASKTVGFKPAPTLKNSL